MKRIGRISAIAAAVMAFAGGAAYAQEIQTPTEALETGFDDNTAVTRLSGPVGGTIASEAGGAIRIPGGSFEGLVMTPAPDSDPAYFDTSD